MTTIQLVPIFVVLSVGLVGGLLGGGVMFWLTRNRRAALIVAFAGLITAVVWLLQGVFR